MTFKYNKLSYILTWFTTTWSTLNCLKKLQHPAPASSASIQLQPLNPIRSDTLSFFFAPAPLLPPHTPTHPHTHTCTHTTTHPSSTPLSQNTHTHTHTHSYTLLHAHPCTHARSHAHNRTHARTHSFFLFSARFEGCLFVEFWRLHHK